MPKDCKIKTKANCHSQMENNMQEFPHGFETLPSYDYSYATTNTHNLALTNMLPNTYFIYNYIASWCKSYYLIMSKNIHELCQIAKLIEKKIVLNL